VSVDLFDGRIAGDDHCALAVADLAGGGLAEVEEAIAGIDGDMAKVNSLGVEYERVQEELEQAYAAWNQATAELDELSAVGAETT
jgi:hypothetical protein